MADQRIYLGRLGIVLGIVNVGGVIPSSGDLTAWTVHGVKPVEAKFTTLYNRG